MTPAAIAAVRKAVLSTLAKGSRCSIWRKTYTPGPLGSEPSWAASTPSVCARMRALNASELPEGVRIDALRLFRFAFPGGTDIRASDRIQFDGSYFSVTGVDDPLSGPGYLVWVFASAEDGDAINNSGVSG